MKQRLRLGVMLLSLCLLLQSCAFPALPWQKKPEPTAPVASDLPTDSSETTESDPALVRYVNYGARDYLKKAPVDMVAFSEMVYTQPDVDGYTAACDALVQKAQSGAKAKQLLADYYDLYDRYTDFYTMDALAEVRYSQNISDAYYADAYAWCESMAPTVEEGLESVMKAFAACPQRQTMERMYFGGGYFLYYDDYEVYTNEYFLRLSEQEAELLNQYRELMEDPQIVWEGKEQSLWDLQADADYDTYHALMNVFYETYNPRIVPIYIELVKVRNRLAQTLGYQNYAQYAYEMIYDRDYTPIQGKTLAKDIRDQLLPVYDAIVQTDWYYTLNHRAADEAETYQVVQTAAEALGGAWADAFRFMDRYGLYDISQAPEKEDISYQTYLYSYEAPMLIVNSVGDSSDFTAFAHEFGHFTEAYYTYAASEDLETAETYSQATEFLALCYTTSLSDREREQMLRLKLLDALETFLSQASYARFEERVYALPESELTVDRVNEISREVNLDYGYYDPEYDNYYTLGWIEVTHFFSNPFYVISYCVSADTSLQVYQLEAAEPGAGVKAFEALLDRGYAYGVKEVMKNAGLENPFSPGRMQTLADFFRQELLR